MSRRTILLKCLLPILLIGFVGVTIASGDPGQAFWSVYVGNYWNRSGTDGGDTWTARDEFIGTETIGGQKTFKLDEQEDGGFEGNEWYQVSLSEIKLWKKTYYDDDVMNWITITLDNGLPVGKNPIIVGDSWSNTTSGTGNGYPGTVTIAVAVQTKENVTTPLGTYHAFKVKYDYTVSAPDAGYFATDTEYKWFVPYLGVVKWQSGDLVETELVTSMKVRKGLMVFDRDSDAKSDIAVYRKNTGAWYIKPSTGGAPYGVGWGGDASDKPSPGDYDGDGKTDIAVYRAGTEHGMSPHQVVDRLMVWAGVETLLTNPPRAIMTEMARPTSQSIVPAREPGMSIRPVVDRLMVWDGGETLLTNPPRAIMTEMARPTSRSIAPTPGPGMSIRPVVDRLMVSAGVETLRINPLPETTMEMGKPTSQSIEPTAAPGILSPLPGRHLMVSAGVETLRINPLPETTTEMEKPTSQSIEPAPEPGMFTHQAGARPTVWAGVVRHQISL
jgi:hypothetical protein